MRENHQIIRQILYVKSHDASNRNNEISKRKRNKQNRKEKKKTRKRVSIILTPMPLPSKPYSQIRSAIPVSELRDAARNTSLFNQVLATLHPTIEAAITGV